MSSKRLYLWVFSFVAITVASVATVYAQQDRATPPAAHPANTAPLSAAQTAKPGPGATTLPPPPPFPRAGQGDVQGAAHATMQEGAGQSGFLDGMPQVDRNRLLETQKQTYALTVDTDYLIALQAYCATGWGDRRCLKQGQKDESSAAFTPSQVPLAKPPVGGAAESGAPLKADRVAQPTMRSLPTVFAINGFGDDLEAILTYGDGEKLRVIGPDRDGHARSQLLGGEEVLSIKPGAVVVKKPADARPTTLLLTAGLAPATNSEQPVHAPQSILPMPFAAPQPHN